MILLVCRLGRPFSGRFWVCIIDGYMRTSVGMHSFLWGVEMILFNNKRQQHNYAQALFLFEYNVNTSFLSYDVNTSFILI